MLRVLSGMSGLTFSNSSLYPFDLGRILLCTGSVRVLYTRIDKAVAVLCLHECDLAFIFQEKSSRLDYSTVLLL